MLDSMVSNFAARSRAVQYPKNKMDAHRELFRKAGLSVSDLDVCPSCRMTVNRMNVYCVCFHL